MSAQTLVLHRGARETTLDRIARVVTPEPTETWYPIPHLDVLEAVEETLQAASFEVRARRLALSSNEAQFFATLDLTASVGTGVSLSVGIRNSIDKTLPLGFCAGNRVFVCDNLSFSAELLVNRKHTVNGGARFREAIALATGRLDVFRASEAASVGLMQSTELDGRTAESLILRAWEAKVISHYQLPAVLDEWREPSHEAFEPRTRWSLFNAFTEVLRPFSESNPQAFAGRTFRLNQLLVPPNEGPVNVEASAALASVGPVDGAPTEDRSTADAFWSSYSAGY
jgi:hypothetical protein